jgi:hypothetical protein
MTTTDQQLIVILTEETPLPPNTVAALAHRLVARGVIVQPVPEWVGRADANGEVHCSRLAPHRCMYLEGHYGGCATP